ncbi:MAG: hypothetical protein LBH39_07200, partial [Clostridiales Family XIII bacterium]|nr:hypothetical protein [Clostridiales Family XIII bacterium]
MCNHLEHQCLTLKFKRRRSEKPNPPAGDLAGASQALPDAVGGTHDANEYIMFGYYGHLQIETHDNWQKFNPMETPYAYYSHMQDFPKQEYQDEYPLKLIGTGPSAALKNPEEEGYFGHGYKPGGAEGQHFIAVAMLHLSQETVKQSLETGRAEALAAVVAGPEDAMAMHVKWHIIESVKELMDDGNFGTEDGGNLAQVFKAINCTVYYTIGFPDIVIIFQTKRLDWVSDICYALRARSVDAAGVDTGKPFLSASYLLCGMHVASKLESSIDESVENLRASIRFLLKQGKVPKLFFHEFINKMSERRVGVQLNEFGQMYGNSDVLWIPDAPLDGKLLNEYIKMDGLLNPAGAFYNEWIAMMRTSIRRVFEEAATIDPSRKLCPIDADADVVPDRGAERLILRWRQSLKRYCRERDRIYLISANAMNAAGGQNGGFKFEENSSRMLKGAEQMANLYYDLARSAHAYDLRSMLDPTLRVFRANM